MPTSNLCILGFWHLSEEGSWKAIWSNPHSEQGELKSGCSQLCPLKFGLYLAMEVLDSVGKLSKTPVESEALCQSEHLVFILRH